MILFSALLFACSDEKAVDSAEIEDSAVESEEAEE
tara:strand:+ start:935 stop:1039 length:105 start_codon:yes stop_codon:yes gene_type:complete